MISEQIYKVSLVLIHTDWIGTESSKWSSITSAGLTAVFPVWSGSVILLRRDGFHSAEVIEHPDLCDVHLGEEPAVVGGPVDHLWMSTEQSGFSHRCLAAVHLKQIHHHTITYHWFTLIDHHTITDSHVTDSHTIHNHTITDSHVTDSPSHHHWFTRNWFTPIHNHTITDSHVTDSPSHHHRFTRNWFTPIHNHTITDSHVTDSPSHHHWFTLIHHHTITDSHRFTITPSLIHTSLIHIDSPSHHHWFTLIHHYNPSHIWRFSTARYGTVRLSSGRFAFPLQFSTAIEWAGLFTRCYNCATSTAVTSS